MDAILTQLSQNVNTLFDEQYLELLARETGFIKRKRKMIPKDFFTCFLKSALNTQNGSLDNLSHALEGQGCSISKQSLSKKFNSSGERFLRRLLTKAIRQMVNTPEKQLHRFPFIKSVKSPDSSEIRLNSSLETIFPHSRKQGAAVKLQAVINVLNHHVERLDICPSKAADQGYKDHIKCIQPGELWVGDLGYFSYETFNSIEKKGGYYLSRHHASAHLYDRKTNKRINLSKRLNGKKRKKIEFPVFLTDKRLPCRCVAIRLTEPAYQKRLAVLKEKDRKDGKGYKTKRSELTRWTIFITNLPPEVNNPEDFLKLYSLRWQIELFFKMMKQFMKLRRINATNRYRAMMSIYSSLIAIVLLTSIVVTITDKEISIYKAAKIFLMDVKAFIDDLLIGGSNLLCQFREKIEKYAIKESRKNRPSTMTILNQEWADA